MFTDIEVHNATGTCLAWVLAVALGYPQSHSENDSGGFNVEVGTNNGNGLDWHAWDPLNNHAQIAAIIIDERVSLEAYPGIWIAKVENPNGGYSVASHEEMPVAVCRAVALANGDMFMPVPSIFLNTDGVAV